MEMVTADSTAVLRAGDGFDVKLNLKCGHPCAALAVVSDAPAQLVLARRLAALKDDAEWAAGTAGVETAPEAV